MTQLTRQEAFDKVWDHFVTRGQPRSVYNGTCLYRSPNGARCAIGVLMKDEEYRPDFDVRSNFSEVVASCEAICGIDPCFLADLQRAHDGALEGSGAAESGRDIRSRLADFAGSWNLQVAK